MTASLPAKQDVARALLLRGSVFVHLDPRRFGVLVPAHLRRQTRVVLQVGLDMPVPIPDLRVDDEGVFGTLSFKGVPFSCFVPWGAVFSLIGDDAEGVVWPREMPEEIADVLVSNKRKKPVEAPPPVREGNVVSFAAARARLRPNAPFKGSPFRPGA